MSYTVFSEIIPPWLKIYLRALLEGAEEFKPWAHGFWVNTRERSEAAADHYMEKIV